MSIVVFASVALGLLLGAAVGYLLSRRLVLRIAASARRPSVVKVSAGLAGLVALAPSAFVAFILYPAEQRKPALSC